MKDTVDLIYRYFPNLDALQRERFDRLDTLYALWNSRINLISRKDMDHFYERHVLHSLGIAKVVAFREGTSVLDAGTGGGFPGIPLAILFPQVCFHLMDSIGKKISVLREVVSVLGLENVTTEQVRVEDAEGRFDFALSRAVAPLPELFGWLKGKIRKGGTSSLSNGLLCLKGGDLESEIKPFGSRVRLFELRDYFTEAFFETKQVAYLKV